ncbi:hypothetical protein [Streptomyces yerevanensis]|uniref:hypothetical protein n=1 Tax=Streptomyces yerevanensis TaxID=66378 RepID=UPI0005271838|nr:hypothetical protein [Streptomyces yerevanensis]
MDKRRITRSATGAAVTALALGALQSASAAGADGETKGGGGAPAALEPAKVCVGTQPEGRLPSWGPKGSRPDDTPLYRVLAYIDRMGKAHPGIFTGFSVDDANGAANVYRIPGKEAEKFDADICGAAEKGVTVRLYDTEVTETELKELVDRISGDMDRWKGTFMIWTVGMNAHSVVMGVSDPEKAAPVLREAYGEETMRHIKIERSEPPTLF